MAFLRHDFSCFFSFLQNSARRSAAYPLRGYCYFSRFLWLFHRLPPMHTEGVRSELPGLFLSRRYWPPSPKPYWLFLSNFPLYRLLSMVIIFVLNSGFSDRNHIHDSGPAEIRISAPLTTTIPAPLALTIPAPPKFAFPNTSCSFPPLQG